MSRRAWTPLVLALIAGACLVVVSPAAARTRHFSETIRSVPISTDATFPAAGSGQLAASIISTKAFGGQGAQIYRLVATGQPSANTLTFRVTGTDFFGAGTQRWKASGTATIQADGSITSTGKGSFTGGTGRFRHARGPFTFTSAQAANSQLTVLKSTGTLRY